MAVIILQNQWRSYRARKQYVTIRTCVIKLQAACRGFLTRKMLKTQSGAACMIQMWWKACLCAKHEHQIYVKQKESAVCIQKHFRMYSAKCKYELDKGKIIKLQSAWRKYHCQKQYCEIKKATSQLQYHWRAILLGRNVRSMIVKHNEAATIIQVTWKRYATQRSYTKIISAVMCIQKNVRMYQKRQKYLKIIQAVAILQTRIRSTLLCIKLSAQYQKKRAAVVLIQAYFRGFRERKKFANTIQAVIKIQSYTRFFIQYHKYHQLKSAALKLQMKWRATLVAKQTRQNYVHQLAAVKCIQRCFRKYMHKVQREEMIAQVVLVQSIVRRFLAKLDVHRRRIIMVQERKQAEIVAREAQVNHFILVTQRHLAVIKIQRAYRKRLSLKLARQKIKKVVLIQHWIREHVLPRLRYMRLVRSLPSLQRAARRYLQTRHEAATKIQATMRMWFTLKRLRIMDEAASFIQAMWRGRRVRLSISDKKVHAARKRCWDAQVNATDEKRLGNRTTSALEYLLHYKQLALVLEAVMNLEVSTRLSPTCCERMVANHAVPVLYKLIIGCNRSLPHMEIIKYSVCVLLNLAKYEKTRHYVYSCPKNVDIITDVMRIFREKQNGEIFCKCCTLLGLICQDVAIAKAVMRDDDIMSKLRSFKALTLRKFQAEEKRDVVKNRLAAAKAYNSTLPVHTPKKSKVPNIRPEWVLAKNKAREITNPLQAINFTLATLGQK